VTESLETPRLSLRRFADSEADGRLLVELDSDPEVMRYIGPTGLTTVEAARELIRGRIIPSCVAGTPRGGWAAHLKPAGEFIGWFFLRSAPASLLAAEAGWTRPTDLEVGYRLRRAAWGRGLATEGEVRAGAIPGVRHTEVRRSRSAVRPVPGRLRPPVTERRATTCGSS